jgi:hypothetical protein
MRREHESRLVPSARRWPRQAQPLVSPGPPTSSSSSRPARLEFPSHSSVVVVVKTSTDEHARQEAPGRSSVVVKTSMSAHARLDVPSRSSVIVETSTSRPPASSETSTTLVSSRPRLIHSRPSLSSCSSEIVTEGASVWPFGLTRAPALSSCEEEDGSSAHVESESEEHAPISQRVGAPLSGWFSVVSVVFGKVGVAGPCVVRR